MYLLFQVEKAKNYASVHFNTHEAAERAYEATKENLFLDNCRIEVTWSKPTDRHIHSQKKLAPEKTNMKLGQIQQTSFAAQNLEDLAMYDVDRDDACKECTKKMTAVGHFKYVFVVKILYLVSTKDSY